MINIVLYGGFLWVLLTGYPNIMKSELLNEVDEVWGRKARFRPDLTLEKSIQQMYKGINRRGIRFLTSSIGNIYKNYGYDPLEKMLVLACAILSCSQFLLGKEDRLYQGINNLFSWFLE